MGEEIAKRDGMAMARPDWLKEGRRGTENIQRGDIRPPALRLAQAMSPEVKRAEPQYIDGLREGDLFNSITQEIYGDGPVKFLIVNYLGHRNVEFDPNDRNVVIDGNVPDNDPRCNFTMGLDDNNKPIKKKPRATQFKDFLILLLRDGSDPALMTLTLKSTQLKKATRLLSVLQFSKLDTFSFLIQGTPVPERKGKNSWYGWRFDPVGYPTEAQYNEAARVYDEMKDKEITPETEGDAVAGADEPKDDDIPF